MKKSRIWILLLLIVAIAAWGFKGTLNTATNVIDGGLNAVWNVADKAADVAKDTGDAVWEAANDAVDVAADAAQDVVDLVDDAGEAVADAADNAADAVWDAIDFDDNWDVEKVEVVEGNAEPVVAADQEDTEGEGANTDDTPPSINIDKSSVEWTGRAMWKAHNWTINITQVDTVWSDWNLSSGTFIIDMDSIKATDIDSEKLDNHLKADDFFDVAAFPTATLEIKSIEDSTANADLTIKGTTLPISFDIITSDEWISTTFSIDSSKWGVVEWLQDAIVKDDIDFDIFLGY